MTERTQELIYKLQPHEKVRNLPGTIALKDRSLIKDSTETQMLIDFTGYIDN